MKLDYLMADNFLRLNLLEVDMSGATVHLFAGNNEAGKTSIQEAIRFALQGDTPRVGKTIAERALMIRDGSKAGTVGIKVDGVNLIREIKSGKFTQEDMNNVQLPPFLPFLLDAQAFARMTVGARRDFLIRLTGIKTDPEDIERRMKAKGVHERCIADCKAQLRISLTEAHKYAVKQQASAREQWVGLTGRARYGSQIAADWKPDTPEGYDPQALLDSEKESDTIQEAIDALNTRIGSTRAKLEEAKKALATAGTAEKFDPKKLKAAVRAVDAESILLAGMQSEYSTMNAQLANAREKAPVTCCKCHTQLRVSFRGNEADVSLYKPLTEEEEGKLQAQIIQIASEISDKEGVIRGLRAEVVQHQRLEALAAGSGPAVTQKDVDGIEEQLGGYIESLTQLGINKAAVSESLGNLRAAATLVQNAEKIEARAGSLHRGVQAWGKCVEALAPDGIPAEILSDTLKPVNNRLRETSLATRWPQITIDPTMEIQADGRRYSLLSESSRWRADAALADAIAHLSGLKLLVLDRIDVLDLANRGALMGWVQGIMGDYETILLFGTLKALPKLPAGMQGHWVENGEIAKNEAA